MALRYLITCDYCGRNVASDPRSAATARQKVREKGGFTRVSKRGAGRGKDACEKCAAERSLW